MKRYVLGFVFNESKDRILLQLRTVPKWQHGLYNGIGGHVEDGEEAADAMVREAKEETNLYDLCPRIKWRNFATVNEEHGKFTMECFTAQVPAPVLLRCTAPDHEEFVAAYLVATVPRMPVIENLRYLVPMARDPHLSHTLVTERSRG